MRRAQSRTRSSSQPISVTAGSTSTRPWRRGGAHSAGSRRDMATRLSMGRSTAPAALLAAFLGAAVVGAADTPGKLGGTLVVAQTGEPKTFNPVTATDQPTRDVLSVMFADLVHINRRT